MVTLLLLQRSSGEVCTPDESFAMGDEAADGEESPGNKRRRKKPRHPHGVCVRARPGRPACVRLCCVARREER